jgi:hypothetical protein
MRTALSANRGFCAVHRLDMSRGARVGGAELRLSIEQLSAGGIKPQLSGRMNTGSPVSIAPFAQRTAKSAVPAVPYTRRKNGVLAVFAYTVCVTRKLSALETGGIRAAIYFSKIAARLPRTGCEAAFLYARLLAGAGAAHLCRKSVFTNAQKF